MSEYFGDFLTTDLAFPVELWALIHFHYSSDIRWRRSNCRRYRFDVLRYPIDIPNYLVRMITSNNVPQVLRPVSEWRILTGAVNALIFVWNAIPFSIQSLHKPPMSGGISLNTILERLSGFRYPPYLKFKYIHFPNNRLIDTERQSVQYHFTEPVLEGFMRALQWNLWCIFLGSESKCFMVQAVVWSCKHRYHSM